MLALRAFAVGHFAAKLAWSFLISLSNPSRNKKEKRRKIRKKEGKQERKYRR
jgi:hypothetical protein